jgi:hypothetical protein
MKKIFTNIIFCILIIQNTAAQKSCDWSKISTATQTTASTQPDDIALDKQGSSYQIGTYQSTISFGTQTVSGLLGKYSVFLVKYSPTGLVTWAKTFVTEGNAPLFQNICTAEEAGKSYIYVSGRYRTAITIEGTKLTSTATSDNYIAKLDIDGKLIWAKSFQSSSFFLNDMAASLNGNVIIGGQFFGALQYETTVLNTPIQKGYKSVLLCIAPDGKYVWSNIQKTNGAASTLTCLRTNNSNEIFVGGSYVDTLAFDTKKSVSLNNQVGAAKKPWLAKFSGNGTCTWIVGASGGLPNNNTNSVVNAVLPFGNGDLYFTGQLWNVFDFAGKPLQGNSKGKTMDPFMGKIDEYGKLLWIKAEGGFASQGNENGVGICINFDEFPTFVINIDSTQTWSNGQILKTAANSQDILYVTCWPNTGQYKTLEIEGSDGVEYAISAVTSFQRYMINGITAGKSKFGSIGYNNPPSNKGETFVYAKCPAAGVAQYDVFDAQISIFPNPFNDQIEIQNIDNELIKYSKINIFDINGQLIWKQNIDTRSNKTTINTEQFQQGIYLIQLIGEDNILTKRIVKE